MNILKDTKLESNPYLKINFNGGDLSSDTGLLLIKEFAEKIGLVKLVNTLFQTNDSATFRLHIDPDNLMQVIYQTIAAYFEDDCADELTVDPVFTAILDKPVLASQPTLSRFYNRMDETTLTQLELITEAMRDIVYSIQHPEHMIFDLDTTLLNAYGRQEGNAFNYHYQANGYHPLFCYDGITGDLLKEELRDGSQYCSRDSDEFMRPLIQEYRRKYSSLPLYLRGDSGFASPGLYEVCEEEGCKYAIRLKLNNTLITLAEDVAEDFRKATMNDIAKYAVTYGEFMYQAGTWSHQRRVVFKIEKPADRFDFNYTFIVTTMTSEPYKVIQFYCGRGKMENFIKEGKDGFDFSAVSSHSKLVNANRLRIHVLAYNLFNWFRRIALAANMRKLRIDTVRLKLLKIAARAVHSAGYITFKLCSSCPYKNEFYETLLNIRQLKPLLE